MLPLLSAAAAHAAPIPVTLEEAAGGGWALRRGGERYVLRGVGGSGALELLADIGGTTIRTWGVDEQTPALLDEAHALGLSVSVGLWLGHTRHGFDYGDPAQVAAQREEVRAAVAALKDHPAVLLWGVGNEMEGFEEGDDPQVWDAVCDIAEMIQGLDPHHPVMTTTADIGGGRIAAVDACPHIDLHGVNTYGGAASLVERYRAGGGRKPIVLTEYGPPGTWETEATGYGAAVEPTSTEKAPHYARTWARVVEAEPLVVGGCAFLWGWKTEGTATWYGLLLPDGARLGGVDALAEAWGRPPTDRVPQATPLHIEGGDRVRPGARVKVTWSATDPEGGPVETRWVLRREIMEASVGGDAQGLPPALPDAVVASSATGATLRLPRSDGVYRIYAEARDGMGGAATASAPLLVGAPREEGGPLPMPWWIYQDEGVGGPWVPSGFMGAPGAFTMDLGWTDGCASPPSCIRVETSGADWSGVAWQVPANNWGSQPGGLDLSEARWLRFKVRAEFGWGTMTAGVGLIGDDQPYPDSLAVEETVALTREWQEVRIRLRGDRSHLITGFWWVLPTQRPATIYIDDIVFE